MVFQELDKVTTNVHRFQALNLTTGIQDCKVNKAITVALVPLQNQQDCKKKQTKYLPKPD